MALVKKITSACLQRSGSWSKHAWAMAGLSVLVLGADAAFPQCPERRVQFSITDAQISQMEQSEAEGHQPWRSNAKLVADSGLLDVEGNIDPRTIDTIPFKRNRLSGMREVYNYGPIAHGRRAQVTVRRFRWKDPQAARTQTTIWWVTEVVIEGCAIHTNK